MKKKFLTSVFAMIMITGTTLLFAGENRTVYVGPQFGGNFYFELEPSIGATATMKGFEGGLSIISLDNNDRSGIIFEAQYLQYKDYNFVSKMYPENNIFLTSDAFNLEFMVRTFFGGAFDLTKSEKIHFLINPGVCISAIYLEPITTNPVLAIMMGAGLDMNLTFDLGSVAYLMFGGSADYYFFNLLERKIQTPTFEVMPKIGIGLKF